MNILLSVFNFISTHSGFIGIVLVLISFLIAYDIFNKTVRPRLSAELDCKLRKDNNLLYIDLLISNHGEVEAKNITIRPLNFENFLTKEYINIGYKNMIQKIENNNCSEEDKNVQKEGTIPSSIKKRLILDIDKIKKNESLRGGLMFAPNCGYNIIKTKNEKEAETFKLEITYHSDVTNKKYKEIIDVGLNMQKNHLGGFSSFVDLAE